MLSFCASFVYHNQLHYAYFTNQFRSTDVQLAYNLVRVDYSVYADADNHDWSTLLVRDRVSVGVRPVFAIFR